MIHFTYFQTIPKIPEKSQNFHSRDKIPKSESTDGKWPDRLLHGPRRYSRRRK